MPKNKQERAQHLKKNLPRGNGSTAREQRAARSFIKMIKGLHREFKQLDRVFQSLPGATLADKQTTFFDYLSTESDGDLMLHDLGIFFDAVLPLVNDYRQPEDDAAVTPFTNADVTAYLP